jgi:signal transduction histidine kinase
MKRLIYEYRRHLVFFLLFAAIGYVAARPAAIFVYTLTHGYEREALQAQREFAKSTYQPMMFLLSLAFLFIGGLGGLLLGIIADRRHRMRALERRREIALETLHELMVTLSHYLLNANAVIGGMARRTKRSELSTEGTDSLSVIEAQARKIDAVIQALQKITELKTCAYAVHGETLMIDIVKDIEEELGKAENREEELRLK